jgi:hypothetical protein
MIGGGHGGSLPMIDLDPRQKLGRCCERRNLLPGVMVALRDDDLPDRAVRI